MFKNVDSHLCEKEANKEKEKCMNVYKNEYNCEMLKNILIRNCIIIKKPTVS